MNYPEGRSTCLVPQGLLPSDGISAQTVSRWLSEAWNVGYRPEQTDTAVAIVETLEPTTYSAVLLADLYATQRNWHAVVELTDGIKNEDDASTFLLIQRGAAFRELGLMDAARECLKLAFAARSRMPELRHLALAERARTNLADGKKAMARKDVQRILADNSAYPGIDELLARAD